MYDVCFSCFSFAGLLKSTKKIGEAFGQVKEILKIMLNYPKNICIKI